MTMFRLRIFSLGKTKEQWLDDAIDEFCKRLQAVLKIEFVWVRSDEQLVQAVLKEPRFLCLDSTGIMRTSEQFSTFIMEQFEVGGSRLAIVIGGPEGLPPLLKKSCKSLISFSPMTFTHQMVRLILVEQIYRAFEIERKSQYHK
jgi:23S rRNA (pseudouridine1915-N3)-methyltransferase